MDNWNLIGHEWAVQLLRQHIRQGRLRHAYLFTGPAGVGRRTLALRLAQAINCPNTTPEGDPCLSCRTCTHLERMQHPDLTITQSDPPGSTLKIEYVREMQRNLSLAPYEARYRVALLLRFEEAKDAASNALLKTLEEPPAQVILMVTAESPEALLPTIVSRCEVLRLRPLPPEHLRQGLETRGIAPESVQLLAQVSGGRPGYALRLGQDPEQLAQRQAWLDDLLHLSGSDVIQRFAYADALTNGKDKDKEKETIRAILLVWLSFWRDVMLRSAGAQADLSNPDRSEDVQRLVQQVGLERAHRAIAALERTQNLMASNTNRRLALEVLMLDLPRLK